MDKNQQALTTKLFVLILIGAAIGGVFLGLLAVVLCSLFGLL
jgi:hypothetical protein